MNYSSSYQRGFTLVELLLALSIFIVVISGVAALTVYYFQNYSFSLEEQQSINIAQTGLTQMVREIREMKIAEDGSWPIVDAQDESLTFYGDVTNDGKSEKVRYFISGTTLNRGIIEPIGFPPTYPQENEKINAVANPVSMGGLPMFTYYNGNWPGDSANNPLVFASRNMQTRFIHIHVIISISPNQGSQPFELSTGVSLRNLKDNL